MKKIFLSCFCLFILFLTACSNNSVQVVEQPTETVVEKKYSTIKNEEKIEFPISEVTINTTSEQWNYNVFNDYNFILDTTEEIIRFPYLYEQLNIYNTAPKMYIIPRFYQQQYSISNIAMENGIITVKYKTENNAKIDRLIGQITNIEYKIYAIDLSQLPDGQFNFTLVHESDNEIITSKDFDIIVPKPILTWETKNLNTGKNSGDIIFSSNKTGNWQIFKYIADTKEIVQLSDRHSDIDIENLNMLGYMSNNSNIPHPIYNSEQDVIIYSIGSDIYKVNYDGSRNYLVSFDMEDRSQPNGFRVFENKPIATNSGYKILYKEIFEPSSSELYLTHFSDFNKKEKIPLPQIGNINFFSFGKNDKEYVVSISNQKNQELNGYYELWVINKEGQSRQLKTYGYKIHSANVSSNGNFIILSQNLNSYDKFNQNDLYYINLNNTELKRITPSDNYGDFNPVISPNNRKVAYMSTTNNTHYNLWVSDINGENREMITDIYITDVPLWLNNYEIAVIDSFGGIIKVNIETKESETIVDGFDKIDEEALINELNKSKIYSIEE